MEEKSFASRVNLGKFDRHKGLDRGAGKLKEACWYLIKVIFFLTAVPFPSGFKIWLLRLFGARIGKGTVIKPRVNIHFPWKLELGDQVWLGEEVFILNFEPVYIGSNCCVSQRVFLCGGNHDFRDPAFSYRNGPIAIGEGAWVGASSFVGPGVVIGADAVITACSVVTTNLEPNNIYKGNPAVFLRKRWV